LARFELRVYLGAVEDNEGQTEPAEDATLVALVDEALADEPVNACPTIRLVCPICGLDACGHNLSYVEVPA
jgi:hypothetical protein